MSTDAYLAGLDLDQLMYARDRANSLIEEKRREEKSLIWSIMDSDLRLACFARDDYLKAADTLSKVARQYVLDQWRTPKDLSLRLVPEWVPKSELAEWLAIQF